MHPHSHYLLHRLVEDRIRQLHREAEAARAIHLLDPGARGLRRRLALQLQNWAEQLDPELLEVRQVRRLS